MSKWQPIETAPHFSSLTELFLVYDPTAKKRKIKMSRGGGSGEKWFREKGFTIFDDRNNPCKATHWKPLPGPPKHV